MSFLCNSLYLVVLIVLSPWLLIRSWLTGRYRNHVRAKLRGLSTPLDLPNAPVWFHGVSVGEIHLLTTLVAAFRARHPDIACVVSTTTDTGYAEARKRFPDLPVIVWPFDFTWAIQRTLNAVQPRMIVLAESELWPNMLRECELRQIPVIIVNGRMSPRSFARYRRFRWLTVGLLLRKIRMFALQSTDYRDRLAQLGLPADRLIVTGSIKYDGANPDRQHPRINELRRDFGITAPDRVWVAGSTHAPEEAAVLKAFVALREQQPHLRLILVPRSPDRFDEVARLIEQHGLPVVRRSQMHAPTNDRRAVILLDTLGELGFAWGLADIGFVGGTLDGVRGGQSMIEPAAYGVPTVFGPHTWNFRDAVARLLEVDGAVQFREADQLTEVMRSLLADPLRLERMGQAARQLVRAQQGATQRTLDALDTILNQPANSRRSA